MITNLHNLPEPIFNAVNREYKPNPERFSVTDLIGPPLIRQLKILNWDGLAEDASDRLWMLLGSAVDHIVSQNAKDAIVQHKFEISIKDIVVVGKADLYLPNDPETIEDWKVTSAWSFLLGDKKDWEDQLNCYAWGFRRQDMRVKKLRINAILRDWQKSKMMRDDDYPRIPFVSKEIPLWTFDQQEQYITDRLKVHQSEPTECTPDEKWEKPTTYAVMKKGRKSALRVLESHEKALQWCIDNDHAQITDEPEGKLGRLASNISIDERKGECVRCKDYCPVRTVCEFAKK